MHRLILPLSLLIATPALAAPGEAPFVPSGQVFASAAACRAELVELVAEARRGDHAAVEGPYEVATGDVRAHLVRISGSGHRITEHRCAGEKLSTRTWRHSMDGAEEETAQTIDSMAAKAEWLKKPPAK
jgi:hypothetical protein